MIQCQIYIGKGLCLHSLRRIHYKDRAVAGCKASGYLIVEIYMPRCVDQVEHIFFPVVRLVDRTDCLSFDRDASLSLQIHIVEDLSLHLTVCKQPRHLNDTVCQCGFSVIYVCNDTKISDFTLIYYCQFDSSILFPAAVQPSGHGLNLTHHI